MLRFVKAAAHPRGHRNFAPEKKRCVSNCTLAIKKREGAKAAAHPRGHRNFTSEEAGRKDVSNWTFVLVKQVNFAPEAGTEEHASQLSVFVLLY